MLTDGAVAWLDVPLTSVLERVPHNGRRPLATDRAQLEQLYLRREVAYRDAHVRIDGTGPIDEIVERLMTWMNY
jgi:shikimate kinase